MNLHPSQLQQYLTLHTRAKFASWGCLVVAIALLSFGATQNRKNKPWMFGTAIAVLTLGFSQRQNCKQLGETLGDIDETSRLNLKAWMHQQTAPTAQLAIAVPTLPYGWQPENLVSLTEAIAGKQVRIIGIAGSGKSTIAQYLARVVGGEVKVYEPEGTPDDWQGLEVIGKGEDWEAINAGMGKDLEDLSAQLKLRTEKGDSALIGSDRVLIGEEYPEVRTKCDDADLWLERHARRGRKARRFLILLSQFDRVAAWGLEGKSDLIDCFRCVRLGKFAIKHAEKLDDSRLVEWLKQDSFGRCLIDDDPCQLPSYETMKAIAYGVAIQPTQPTPQPLNEYEQAIIDTGSKLKGEIIKARYLQQNVRLFGGMAADDIRILFQSLSDKGLGVVEGSGDRLGWRLNSDENKD